MRHLLCGEGVGSHGALATVCLALMLGWLVAHCLLEASCGAKNRLAYVRFFCTATYVSGAGLA